MRGDKGHRVVDKAGGTVETMQPTEHVITRIN